MSGPSHAFSLDLKQGCILNSESPQDTIFPQHLPDRFGALKPQPWETELSFLSYAALVSEGELDFGLLGA